ncbi:hypothetical protein PP714_10905 [Lacticaseibacillus paracasei]|nr:hypothetical protein [Lacticaseibacillus paracasei]
MQFRHHLVSGFFVFFFVFFFAFPCRGMTLDVVAVSLAMKGGETGHQGEGLCTYTVVKILSSMRQVDA